MVNKNILDTHARVLVFFRLEMYERGWIIEGIADLRQFLYMKVFHKICCK